MTDQHPLFQKVEQARRRRGKVRDTEITLAHSSGGKAMRDLITENLLTNNNKSIDLNFINLTVRSLHLSRIRKPVKSLKLRQNMWNLMLSVAWNTPNRSILMFKFSKFLQKWEKV
ncbi:hypothetical protein Mic7113_4116 [Allocoleopsis franciscana PCC 7113]|uniref:Uncharacterized protein n=1 Tax=Allocoleopsis franciscana PCC 7113 TaxID=1173027 RepID=K9WHZ9_9CYAN|nr:hypothetical protein Mic7113_4116 [Allocoleopsis franciscana PCC 7113]